MFSLQFNITDFERRTRALHAAQDQVPYALALALNKAAENTREVLVREWPGHVKVRQSGFIRYALRRGLPATKHNLVIEIYDQTKKPFMKRLDGGGVHQAKGGNLAIPIETNVKIGAHGVRQSQLPRNMPNAVLIHTSRGPALYQRVGRGKNKKLKLMYVLRPSVPVPSKMPFQEDFNESMRNEVRTSFPSAMARAMATRRS